MLSERQKREMNEDAKIWHHGRRKAFHTKLIQDLTKFKGDPDFDKVIAKLTKERKAMDLINPLD